jgi:hypothetical protein
MAHFFGAMAYCRLLIAVLIEACFWGASKSNFYYKYLIVNVIF